jgi:hypothetical protein
VYKSASTAHLIAEELPDDVEAVTREFYARGWTDGLPVVPPTEERVAALLAGTSLAADARLGTMPPSTAETTVLGVAVNAVMAGCKPGDLPVVVAAIEAMLAPAFLLSGLQTGTNATTPLLIVNGPYRATVDLNSGSGAMGPGRQANACIGRAVRLCLLNIGGAEPGAIDMCTQGFAGKYTLCVGENEEESPFEPFHQSLGHEPGTSVVTVVGVNSSLDVHDSSDTVEDVITTLRNCLANPAGPNAVDPFCTPVLLLNPDHARLLHEAGWTRKSLQEDLFRHCRLDPMLMSNRRLFLRRQKGDEHYLVEGKVPLTNSAERILIAVVGGIQGGHSCFLPNGHYGRRASAVIDPYVGYGPA